MSLAQETTENHSKPTPLRWGILGAARIARRALVPAIRAQNGTIAVIGASTAERAESFAREFDIPAAVEGYQAVLERDDVEAVYIQLANGLHFRWALACARAGKHCLCEKPLVTTAEEARELHEAFGRAGCRLMEAFMWRHHPQTVWTLDRVIEGEIGTLRRIHGAFSFALDRPDDYRWRDDQGGGALWDIGCYCVNAMRLFLGAEPGAVSARSVPAQPGGRADRSTVAWLDFDNDRLGTFECSFTSSYSQSLTLVGTEGAIRLERPVTALHMTVTARIEIAGQRREQTFPPENAYQNMIDHFTRGVRDPSFALEPGEDGLAQARVMESLAASAARAGEPMTL
ncbi:MAG: Gfo/Idh/MocA family oxidoreductase [bacterium]|nr:Gfo/Idh/MocA family oxidoreductase [bacterium]